MFAPTLAISANVFPSIERWMPNPVSLFELSVQDKSISFDEAATAVKPVGAAGVDFGVAVGVGVTVGVGVGLGVGVGVGVALGVGVGLGVGVAVGVGLGVGVGAAAGKTRLSKWTGIALNAV